MSLALFFGYLRAFIFAGTLEVLFTYDVKWEHSEIKWASRWDLYLYMGDDQVHTFIYKCHYVSLPYNWLARYICCLFKLISYEFVDILVGRGSTLRSALKAAIGSRRRLPPPST